MGSASVAAYAELLLDSAQYPHPTLGGLSPAGLGDADAVWRLGRKQAKEKRIDDELFAGWSNKKQPKEMLVLDCASPRVPE